VIEEKDVTSVSFKIRLTLRVDRAMILPEVCPSEFRDPKI